jgi:hypothetical protein
MSRNVTTDLFRSYDVDFEALRNTNLSTTTKQARSLVPVLRFVTHFATQSDSCCRTALKAGILDILLRIYTIFPAFSKSAIAEPDYWSPLLEACRSTILALSHSRQYDDEIFSHPVSTIWVPSCSHPPTYTAELRTHDDLLAARCAAWRIAVKPCVKRRIMMIFTGGLWMANVHEFEDADACTDMVEFAR